MSKPIISAEGLAGFVLRIGNERVPVPVLPALEPAKRALRLIFSTGRRVPSTSLSLAASHELNRHLGLMTAYKAELGLMHRAKLRLRRNAPAAARSRFAAEAPDSGPPQVRQFREPSR